MDMYHAAAVAKAIREETGEDPVVLVSDEEMTNGTVRGFRKSTAPWLVSVRMVSEGTDIKRLQVLCYLTNFATELFFRQLIGRVSRTRDMDDFESYVFLPADPRLKRYALNIENAQTQCLQTMAERESRESRDRDGSDNLPLEFLESWHDGIEGCLIGNTEYSAEDAAIIARVSLEAGTSYETTARVMRALHGKSVATVAEPGEPAKTVSLEERLDHLRRECNKKAFRLSKLRDCDVAEIHGKWPRQDRMTEEQLIAKREQLLRWIGECRK